MTNDCAPRDDYAGAWHHVMNRGLAHRPAFEDRRDVRLFLAYLARAVRAGLLELHAYAILTTHFHLLVRSPRGELSKALGWIENQYVRRFNIRRGRDGSLFRGRFTSRRIEDDDYWDTVVRYIDENAVQARLAQHAFDYEYGSAWHYARPTGPRWLARGEIERYVCSAARVARFDGRAYRDVFGPNLTPGERWRFERRLDRGGFVLAAERGAEHLVRAAPEHVAAWLRECARLAEGRRDISPIVSPDEILAGLACERARAGPWDVATRTRPTDAWHVLATGLLRDACGLTAREISLRLRRSASAVQRACARHDELLDAEPDYAPRAAAFLRRTLIASRTSAPRAALVAGLRGESGTNEAGSVYSAFRAP